MRLLMTMTPWSGHDLVNERHLQRLIMILVCVPIAVFCMSFASTTTGFFVVSVARTWPKVRRIRAGLMMPRAFRSTRNLVRFESLVGGQSTRA
jgi:hypothetical protein